MTRDSTTELRTALLQAITQIKRTRNKFAELPNRQRFETRLDELGERLESIRKRIDANETLDRKEVKGMVRWLTDWIPDLNDPLVSAVRRVESEAERLQ